MVEEKQPAQDYPIGLGSNEKAQSKLPIIVKFWMLISSVGSITFLIFQMQFKYRWTYQIVVFLVMGVFYLVLSVVLFVEKKNRKWSSLRIPIFFFLIFQTPLFFSVFYISNFMIFLFIGIVAGNIYPLIRFLVDPLVKKTKHEKELENLEIVKRYLSPKLVRRFRLVRDWGTLILLFLSLGFAIKNKEWFFIAGLCIIALSFFSMYLIQKRKRFAKRKIKITQARPFVLTCVLCFLIVFPLMVGYTVPNPLYDVNKNYIQGDVKDDNYEYLVNYAENLNQSRYYTIWDESIPFSDNVDQYLKFHQEQERSQERPLISLHEPKGTINYSAKVNRLNSPYNLTLTRIYGNETIDGIKVLIWDNGVYLDNQTSLIFEQVLYRVTLFIEYDYNHDYLWGRHYTFNATMLFNRSLDLQALLYERRLIWVF